MVITGKGKVLTAVALVVGVGAALAVALGVASGIGGAPFGFDDADWYGYARGGDV